MKSILKYFVPMTAAVVALASCNKEKDNKVETPKAPALHITVTATPDELQGDADVEADSKTYIDNKTIKWGTGEYMKIGVFDGSETVFGDSSSESADSGNGSVTHSFSFDITPATASGDYTYYGLYPLSAASTSNNTNPASYKVILPASQSATAASYDPKAYILVAKPESGKTVTNPNWNAWFRRATALNKVTLTNLPEDIKRVKITAPDGKYLAGGRYVNLTTGYSGEIYNGGGRTETVEVRFASKQSHESPIIVWFTSWDAEILVGSNLTIVAYSDAHTYTRTLTVVNKSITFKEGYLNTLNVNMATAVIGDNTELDEGDYVILAKNNTTYYALKGEATGTRLVSVDYTGSLDSYAGTGDIVWSVAASGGSYTIKNGTNYLGWTSGSGNAASLISEEDYSDDKCLMDITYGNSTYLLSVKNDSSRQLARNTSNQYFAFYTGTQYKDLVFVPATVDNRTPVTLSFEDDEHNEKDAVDLTTANCGSFLGLNLVSSENVTAVTEHIDWSYEDNDGVIDEFDDGALTLTGNVGTATVTASFAGDVSYRPATASYTITVTSASISGWVETDLADITSDDVFVMVGNGAYALSSGGGTSTNPPAVAVTVSNGKITAGIVDAIKWNLTGNSEDGYTFYPNGLTTKLFCNTNASSGSNTNLRVGTGGSYNRYVFVLDEDHLVTHDEYTARYIGINGTSDFRGYVAASTNSVTFKFYKYVDSRPSPEMSWSSDAATATYSTGNSLNFSSPTLTPGNATGITYESTDETIATINNAGVVSITALTVNDVKEGSTTIKAIFAGDENYMAQTVSYTLTVVDSRDAMATPTFSPAAGEVAADTEVIISYADGATVYYTVDNSTPTSSSTEYTGTITIDVAKTIKAIATKTGYKPSEIATAAYTISGGVPNDGSLEHPYTVAEALAIIAGYSDKQKSDNQVYVSGIIANVGLYNSTYHSVTYDISDDGANANTLNIYSGKFVANTDFSSNEQVSVSDEVIVYGYLYLYGSTKEMYQNNYIYSLNGITKALTAGTLSTSVNNDNKQITVTWGAATGTESAISYVVTCGTQDYNASAAGSHTFTMDDYGSYSVSVVASADDAVSATAATTAILTDPGSTAKWNLVSGLSGIKNGTYAIAALNSSKYYTVPNTTINGQTFECLESSYSEADGLTPATGSGEFVFTAVSGTSNAFYIYNTNLKKYLVATGSKKFGYVDSTSDDYGYWTFSTVSSGGFSGQFSVQHSSKTHYMRAYNNSVRCYDGANNNGVYLFIYE